MYPAVVAILDLRSIQTHICTFVKDYIGKVPAMCDFKWFSVSQNIFRIISPQVMERGQQVLISKI
jgi:hypothetical protein